MLMLTVAAGMVLVAILTQLPTRMSPLDRKDLARHRQLAEQKCRDWKYPFE
jgi:hypothetical protein